MSEAKPRLTINDPVDSKSLSQLKDLRAVRTTLALQLADMELQKVNLLSAVNKVDRQTQQVYDAILTDRGLAPSTRFNLDGNTGQLKLFKEPAPAEEE